MYQFSNRECYDGKYLIPVTQFNQSYHWPPSHIKCDCSELAKHQFIRSRGYFYPTFIWQCPICQKKYRLIQGTRTFEEIKEEEK